MAEKETFTLSNVITTAIQIPGIKVDRDTFLRDQFKELDPVAISNLIAVGPVAAGCDRDMLRRKADKIIMGTTLVSTGASFLAGLPGGLAMAITIPTDILQFYGAALKMAQEIAYLYGEPDLWKGDLPDDEKITNQLILYCGVMLGASGAAQAVRLMASSLAKQAVKKIPQKALTKTFYYPIIKSILKFFGKNITKASFAKGISKVIPVIGGIVSGGITFASLKPMGKRLQETLDKAHFSYSDFDIQNDVRDIEEETARYEREEAEEKESEVPEKPEEKVPESENQDMPVASSSIDLDGIRKAKQLLDDGIIDEKEFADIKARIIAGK